MTAGPDRPDRTLVVDENLPKRLATELTYRGRNSVSVGSLGLKGSLDPDLLRNLQAQLGDDWILITADDALPEDHADALAEVGGTVATVHPDREPGWGVDAWRREIVHRWAHAIHEQARGTVRRYSLRRHAIWRRRLHRRPR
ncbi:MAG TPA: hypothetical protein VFG79_25540 [Solirubrobacter sp.]|nr:hypothetical protein [Solirubrobacter sp.]